MGALAAAVVMEHIDNGRLYLIAPMANFRLAAKALWNTAYKDKLYTRLIGDETIDEALQIVYERAGKKEQDTALVRRIESFQSLTFIPIL